MVFKVESYFKRRRVKKLVVKVLLGFFVCCAYLFLVKVTVLSSSHSQRLNVKLYSPGSKYDRPNNERIYFHETTKRKRLNMRQTCAVESAAKNNPHKPVQLFMLFTDEFDYSSPWLKVLSKYKNLEIVLVKEEEYFANTPLEDWFGKGIWRTSPFKVAHLADYMRMLSALKGGGLYLDMDMLTLKSYDEITSKDFLVLEDDRASVVVNSVFYFTSGHRLAKKIVSQLASDYDPNSWAFHGSEIFAALMRDSCGFKKRKVPVKNKCNDIKMLEYNTFFALQPDIFYLMFKPATDYSLSLFNESYGVHIWNSKTRHDFLDFSTNQLYSVLAKQHCPLTVKQATRCMS